MEQKGYFALHEDTVSWLMYDLQYMLYSFAFPRASVKQYLHDYPLILAEDGEFSTNGYAPAFVADWMEQRIQESKLVPVSYTHLLCCFALLPLTGCQSGKTEAEQPAAPTLADLPETKDMTVMVEGTEETVSLQKAMHEDFYALYYDSENLIYAPGEVLEDGSFTDAFLSAYDDETIEVPTTMKVCYAPVSYTHLDVYKRQSLPCIFTNSACKEPPVT